MHACPSSSSSSSRRWRRQRCVAAEGGWLAADWLGEQAFRYEKSFLDTTDASTTTAVPHQLHADLS
jgi:hypothetical protein